MTSPIQVVLNPENFQEARDKGGGGPKKDFFADRDQAFRAHKQTLIGQLAASSDVLSKQRQGPIGYLKVILRRSAWAKSHRPIHALFKPGLTEHVGAGDLGELYFEVQPRILRQVVTAIEQAEELTRWKEDPETGRLVAQPSAARSEAGAIERVELYGPRDRRFFSSDEAVAWLANPMTGSSYHIELFDVPPPRGELDAADPAHQLLYSSFLEGLGELGQGLTVQRLQTTSREQPQLALRLGISSDPPTLRLMASTQSSDHRRQDITPFDRSIERHRRLLAFLDQHPLVRRVDLPPIVTRTIVPDALQSAVNSNNPRPSTISVPSRGLNRTYPKIGIIDGGVGPALSDWVVDRWDILDQSDVAPEHGTFIGGLAVVGAALNGNHVCAEPDGAELFDLAVFPDESKPNAFSDYYPEGVPQIFEEIGYAVADAKARHNVRIFNMSLNVQYQAEPDHYSPYAARLDAIAEANNVLFVISAGNTAVQDLRPEWSADEMQALVALASARNDGLLMPAESVRSVSVAALNPPGLPNSISHAPARYSRRGPGLRAGVKPDLAHIGGSGSPQSLLGHGLYSLGPGGNILDGCGTSYAAPLVAKTAAVLEHGIEGEVSRETLVALLLHHAELPPCLRGKPLAGVARDLAGFGKPPNAEQILEGEDHQITMVFAARIRRDQQISFRFAWPQSLVGEGGSCRGSAKLTLVSTPPLDTRFGAEFVRVNIDAALQQEDFDRKGKSRWKGRLDPAYLPGAQEAAIEAERIEHGLKWSPVKQFAKTMPKGVGKSSTWRLLLSYLTRSGEELPPEGVPFTAILTLSDHRGAAPVFTDMRQTLSSIGVRLEDIRTAARVSTRV